MPYLKCSPCRIRVAVTGHDAEKFPPSCPDCCGPLQPAGQLSELVGFRRYDEMDVTRPPASIEALNALGGALAGANPWESALAQALPDPAGWSVHGPGPRSGPTRESSF